MTERIEELESLIDQLELRLLKAESGGSEREANHIRKDIKKFEKELNHLQEEEITCSCSK